VQNKKCFVSHASADAEVATELVKGLETADIACWVPPRDIVPLRPYPEQIVAAVEGSAGLILLHPSHANDSEFVHR
jgi:hypothetical protein